MRLRIDIDVRRRLHAAVGGLSAVALALAVGHGACVEDREVDPQTWEVRDMLGLGPAWFQGMPDQERAALEERLKTLAADQGKAQDRVDLHEELELPEDTAGPNPQPGPRRALSALDARLEMMERQPLLIQWTIFDDADVAQAQACPIPAEAMEADPEAGSFARGWVLDEDFERPLDLTQPEGRTELEALRARLPLIEGWVERCAGDVGAQVAPEGVATRLEVRRAKGAPTLLSYWPQAHRLYVNPALLMLWEPAQEPPQAPLFTRTVTGAQQAVNPYDACLADVPAYCERCDEPTEAEGGTCTDSLLEGSVVDNCQALAGLEVGFRRFCINDALFEFGDSLRQCVFLRTSGKESCTLGEPVTTIEELSSAFQTFAEDPQCVTALRICVEPVDAPDDDFTPTPDPDRPRSNFDDDEPNPCAEALCDTGLQILCIGLESGCEDCDSGDSSSDGGGCEGGGDGGGCEGDSVDGGGSCCEGSGDAL